MDANMVVGLVGILLSLIAVVVSLYALLDARAQVLRLLNVELHRAYVRVLTDTAWLFLDPTEKAHTKDMAKGLEEFCTLAQELNPKRTPNVSKTTVEYSALELAK